MKEIYTSWRWPIVIGKIEHNPKNPLEYAKLWRIAQARAGKPVKFGTCSSQVLAIFLDSHTADYDLDDKKQLIWDMATAMNLELRQLAAAGARVIQVEEPTIHFTAAFHPEETELLDFMVEAFNHEVEGLDDVELWIHTCWGNPMMQKVYSGESYANSIDTYLNRLKGDVWTVEMTERDFAEIDLFKPFAGNLSKKVAVGVVNHRQLQADLPSVVAGRCAAPWRSSRRTSWCSRRTAGSGARAATGPSPTTRPPPSPRAGTSCSRSWASTALRPGCRPGAPDRVLPDREPLTHLPTPWR